MHTDDSFFDNVYAVAKLIPAGRVTSYGAIARAIGSPQAARMVGVALRNSGQDIPAHRVVNRNGLLTGKMHFGTFDTMEELLRKEGVQVENNKIVNFEQHFWNPQSEINIPN